MPAKEEARLTALLWRAARRSEQPLCQDEIDGILGVKRQVTSPYIPQQRIDSGGDAWLRIRTDAGDERWLKVFAELHCTELL